MSDVKPEGIEQLQEKDYRFLLALVFSLIFGFICTLAYWHGGIQDFQAVVAILAPIESGIVFYYFGHKSK